ncbi:nuclear transport factor 2 family protein [Rhodococcus sp. IEGM 1381]|uniref:nuclear transport factor 2 family protein n=1 Tax=Rhodococcus sp. IEGM 1381 TaxID=3047085 RepID=UPI0024B8299E|nr:nuclear transport factor 2 family protein [Rhodococcus sp. IEGM 1381]MDI9897405.1 nuclear transport factor 2 family protein [Rhodococcus sp. IEGM 1381]
MTQDAVALVRAHLEAEDRQDLDATMATFSQECWYSIPTQGYLLRGQEAVRAHYASLFGSFPDLVNEEVTLHDAGDRVFATIVVRRHHRGAWGPFPATGREVVTHALAEFPVGTDGLLEAEIVHINPLEALHQIGVVPTQSVMELAHLYHQTTS